MKYAIMLSVLEGGDFEPIYFDEKSLREDRSIILMDELTPALWLWQGKDLNLIARRISHRKAEWLKSHGYKYGDTHIGRDIRVINEIDQTHLGKDPDTDRKNKIFLKILTKKHKKLAGFIVEFESNEEEHRLKDIHSNSQYKSKLILSDVQSSNSVDISYKKNNSENFIEEPYIPLIKAEYSFETNIKELPSKKEKPILDLNENETHISVPSILIKQIFNRLDRIENKLEEIQKFLQRVKK